MHALLFIGKNTVLTNIYDAIDCTRGSYYLVANYIDMSLCLVFYALPINQKYSMKVHCVTNIVGSQ